MKHFVVYFYEFGFCINRIRPAAGIFNPGQSVEEFTQNNIKVAIAIEIFEKRTRNAKLSMGFPPAMICFGVSNTPGFVCSTR
jgi:hypothetical protein